MKMKKLLLLALALIGLTSCDIINFPSSEVNSSSESSSELIESSSESSNEQISSEETSSTTSSETTSSEKPSSSENTSSENPSSSETTSSEKPSSSENTSSEKPSSSNTSSESSSSNDPSLGDEEQEFDFYRTVSFDTKGGSSIKSVEVIEGNSVSRPTDPTYGDYTFDGWYLDGVLYDFESPVYFDITLEAKWIGASTLNVSKVNFSNSLTMDGLEDYGPLTEGCLPSYKVENEDPKILVFPVRLNPTYNTSLYNQYLDDIKVAFNGTEEETGWESVKSYYQESSYGKLNLDITVWDEWFYDDDITASSLQEMYDKFYSNQSDVDPNEYLITKILDKYNASIDYSQFDSNGDDFIDSIWLIYDEDVNFESDDSMYWAYTSWDYEWYDESYNDCINPSKARDGVYPFYYAWAGTDFMYPDYNQASYDTSLIEIDAHTYIHETGHLLGLDDYYDYDTSIGPDRGLYSADMMDYNIGDHGMISKLLLDWVDPRVVTGSGSGNITLTSFTTTGDFLLIADHEVESIYDTYYLVEFYTSEGLNWNDDPIPNGLGIRINLVHAEVNMNENGEVDWNGGSYDTSFKYDNTDTTTPFVETLSHKGFTDGYIDGSNLYTVGKTFTSSVFDLEVVSITTEQAVVNITLK